MARQPSKTASLNHEHALWALGFRRIVGLDEAGRGAWAGPVAAGAVCLPPRRDDLPEILMGVRDSKQMTARARTRLIDHIKEAALAWGVGSATRAEIDDLGIVPATCLAMERALDHLCTQFPQIVPDYLLVDSIKWPLLEQTDIGHSAMKRGDQESLSIAAASVLAKVWRDEQMIALDAAYPEFGFAQHKGYGVDKHQAALRKHGPTPLHRTTFKPVRLANERAR
ncbi:MAG: ribonuclease HII [Chloroflexi bacterium]|nr:ribonuclease HII [Chloroflexota bacterium]